MINALLVVRQTDEVTRLVSELTRNGFQCSVVTSAENAVRETTKRIPDLLVIDTRVPETEAVARHLREERDLPVLALTGMETVASLDGYVDDFVLRPCGDHEVVLRARRLLRKREPSATPERIEIDGIVIDTAKFEVEVNGRPVALTFREYELLRFLASNPGRVFTRDALLNRVWGQDFFGGDRTVDVHIRRLRSKIEDLTHTYIDTVRNMGYRFVKKG